MMDTSLTTPIASVSASSELAAKIRLAEPWAAEIAENFWNHSNLAAVFPEFMVRLYWSSEGSVKAIRAAERACRTGSRSDPLLSRLADYYGKHYEDECEHPGWLLADMNAVGLDPEEVKLRIPRPSVAALVGSQLYWVENVHPVALLGHFAVLEGSPSSQEQLAAVQRRTGLPQEAFRMMDAHAVIDVEHSHEIDDLLDDLPLDARLRALVGLSAMTTLEKVMEVYSELIALADGAAD